MSGMKGTGMKGIIGYDLLRLDGYMAWQTEDVDGKLYVDATLTDPKVERCRCEEPDVVKHGTRVVHFRDHPIQRQETYIRITRQRYRCRACGTVLLERLPWIDEKKRMTTRFMEQLAEDGIRMKFSMGGEINGVKESLVRRIFKEEAARLFSVLPLDRDNGAGCQQGEDGQDADGRSNCECDDGTGERVGDLAISLGLVEMDGLRLDLCELVAEEVEGGMRS